MNFKRNDVVELRGKVAYDPASGSKTVTVQYNYQNITVDADDLVLVHPGFAVGDKAIYTPQQDGLECEVVAIVGDQAWVKGNYDGIVDMFELKRPEAQEPDVADEVEPPVTMLATPPAPALVQVEDDQPF